MGLFDALEQLDERYDIAEDSVNPPKNHNLSLSRTVDQSKQITEALSTSDFNLPNISFSFLKPCPRCNGRKYTYNPQGSIHCYSCEPAIVGRVIHATGETEEYSSQHNQNAPDRLAKLIEEKQSKNLEQARGCFEFGYLWVTDHLEELLQTGWTRPEIFRRSRHRWPAGNWGLAWLSVWAKTDVRARVTRQGSVEFSFLSCGRAILQTAIPFTKLKRRKSAEIRDQ